MILRFNFEYHNVGQGLFHSGRIEDFNYIFDCGSNNEEFLNQEINNYLINSKHKIDLLVLSHFDYDHVSGLDVLLHKTDVDTVVIPYYEPIFRLIFVARAVNPATWYYNFIENPIGYLIQRKVKRIIIIGGSSSEGSPFPIPIVPNDSKLDSENKNNYKFEIHSNKEDDFLKHQITKNEPTLSNYNKETELLFLNHDSVFFYRSQWIFRFFNFEAKPSKYTDFVNCVTSKFGNKSIKEIIKSSADRKKLKTCYKLINENINYTSLCLIHSPINYWQNEYKYSHIGHKEGFLNQRSFSKKKYYNFHNCIGQLLTGDAFLNQKTKFKQFVDHYQTYLYLVKFCQIPHHGALRNWNNYLIKEMNNCDFWIASAGFSNNYSHPNLSVTLEIINSGRGFSSCNELNGIHISGRCII